MAWRPRLRPKPAALDVLQCCSTRRLPLTRHLATEQFKHAAHTAPAWRPSVALDEWVQRDAKPISLRQLTYFGRTLTESRLLSSANYVRTELPTRYDSLVLPYQSRQRRLLFSLSPKAYHVIGNRLAHRLRDMQTLPYVVLCNPHLAHTYELYYKAFERFRRVPEIQTLDDNDRYCKVIKEMLEMHLSVIPRLAIGVLEVEGLMSPDALDRFMTTLLKSRISRRVICEQHLALTETFHSPWHFPDATVQTQHADTDSVGEIFLRCNGKEIVERCAATTASLMRAAYGSDCPIPGLNIVGDPAVTFPYIQSHLEYIIGELLRNSMQALAEQARKTGSPPPDIEVLICETPQHVFFRFSDRGGGIPKDTLPHLWSFSKGPRRSDRIKNLRRVPRMAATMQELQAELEGKHSHSSPHSGTTTKSRGSSLSRLTSRPPDLKLGIGLPMSKIYAEYWAGSLEIHSLEGYGTDAVLMIGKLGNRNEQLSTRALMDSV
ncbi:uncharacterized protein PV09_02209 [Verruconis gallopava]|uniref:Protein-serine/threonine kinase n=1 Tax=Verruconis gallopava TaxID=253628 RepID=A0A0D2AKI8_9PEZI|nr:uncharacterized protein PV09_02209 [Verruconis gallopava]KIW07363.1 hypothetical protein PV09_02209 [Verruconis gallopava]